MYINMGLFLVATRTRFSIYALLVEASRMSEVNIPSGSLKRQATAVMGGDPSNKHEAINLEGPMSSPGSKHSTGTKKAEAARKITSSCSTSAQIDCRIHEGGLIVLDSR